jgi:L-fuculose-phosphate aldolase
MFLRAWGGVAGPAGNIAAGTEEVNLSITPSWVDYAAMTLDDLVTVDPDGQVLGGTRSPSSEMALHLACYAAYDDIGSVIHSHPVHATMFAVAHQPIPSCIDEFSIYVGGEVRVTEYAASGSADLGSQAVEALRDRGAALIANHGMVAVGPTPDKVLHITALVERSAHILWGARMIGTLFPLPDDVNANFAGVYAFMRTYQG